MKIGISTAAMFPEKNTEEAAEVIKTLGADTTEVFFSTFYEYRPEFSKALAPKTAGLEVNSVHALSLNFEGNLFNASRRVRGDGYYWLDQIARSAQLLNCRNYTFHGFIRAGEREDDIAFLGERFAEAHSFMRRYNVNLCLENTSRFAYARPGFFKQIKNYCPDLSGVFDLKQARRSGYPYAMYIEDMAGAIAYAHISDFGADGKMCLPGKGICDFKEIFKRLKGAGFDGSVIIEPYRRDYGGFEELKESVEFLKETVDKV